MPDADEGAPTAAQYDAMAAPYAAFNEVNAANAHYERPATIALLGEVAGLRVLEVGCGAGPLTDWLADHGADVTAFDVSPAMADLARRRLGDRAEIRVHDLHDALEFAPEQAFDLVVASLVLHYLEHWDGPLSEIARVLRPGGRVVASIHHPAWDWQTHAADDYFAVARVTETWTRGGAPYEVSFWRRPLREVTRAITDAGFVIEELVEAEPLAELEARDPDAYAQLRTSPFFLHLVLRLR